MNLPEPLRPGSALERVPLPEGGEVWLPKATPVFREWTGDKPAFDFGSKPLVDFDGEPVFAELLILRMLLAAGWDGVWVETYGGLHFLRAMPSAWNLNDQHVSIPAERHAVLSAIQERGGTKAAFDVFAWRKDAILFCEAKRKGKDRMTPGQRKFVQGAMRERVPAERLLIVEWTFAPDGR